MLAAMLIVFREVLEAGLIIGIVLAATRGVPGRGWHVAAGIAAGTAGAGLAAMFANEIAMLFEGSGQELLNAGILTVAVLMLGWTVAWMSTHGKDMAAEIKNVGRAVAGGTRPLTALAVVIGVAVLREGAEVVLFLYSLIFGGATSGAAVGSGAALGIAAGAMVSALLYFGLISLPLKHVFKAIALMIALLAAGLAAQAVGLVQSAGYAQILADPLWDTSGLLPENSLIGGLLHTLVGYTAEPTGLQLVAYLGTLAVILAASGAAESRARPLTPLRSGSAARPSTASSGPARQAVRGPKSK
ncbi:MAG: FTR1 family protein [Xanthobacteraceae bacterium]